MVGGRPGCGREQSEHCQRPNAARPPTARRAMPVASTRATGLPRRHRSTPFGDSRQPSPFDVIVIVIVIAEAAWVNEQQSRVLGVVGRLLVGTGAVILLFAAYQLWGTGAGGVQIAERTGERADRQALLAERAGRGCARRRHRSDLLLDHQSAGNDGHHTTGGPAHEHRPRRPRRCSPELVDLLFPAEGEPVGRIRIPRIGVDKVVVEGIGTEDLRKGPGHFDDTPLPGQAGNAAIAGHRTTYGAPFGDIDKLEPGDEIRVTTVLGEAVYTVAGTLIVSPEQVEVVGDYGDNRLTLTACHPKYSAAQRIIVWAMLQGPPTPTLPRPEDRRTIDMAQTTVTPTPASTAASTPATATSTAPTTAAPTSAGPAGAAPPSTVADAPNHLAGDSGAWPGAAAWGAAALLAGAVGWVIARRFDVARGPRPLRRWAIYVLSSPVFGVCLFFSFAHVDRLLPAY